MNIYSLSGTWLFRQAGTDEWLPATVPGGVHTDLLAAGSIPNPFEGDNEKHVQWVAEADWEYRRSFTVDPALLHEDHIFLVCDGLDTLASISLNGHQLGKTNNMFRQYRWEIKPWIRSSSDAANELTISFTSPVKYAAEKQAIYPLPGVSQAIPGGQYLRKAPCQFGWDWGPQLPPIGIWKDLRLEGYSIARIDEVSVRQHHHGGQVEVETCLKVERWSKSPLMAAVRITAPDGVAIEKTIEIGTKDEGSVRIPIAHPELWWPNGNGPQPLYQVEIDLNDPAQSSLRLDQRNLQIGLRTIEVRQQPDQWGRSFEFVVNGVRIFAKGSNWIPADSFPTQITDEHLEGLIKAAAETHQNMLRVWGGGFYEDERFYDLCDKYGILVWQEFIFSCSIYPLNDPEFLENLKIEAEQNVRRLRHRACLALWCGNNEMEWGRNDWEMKYPELRYMKEVYVTFFRQTLRKWCATEDPDHFYWPSSPSSNGLDENPDSQGNGDAHYWDVWHGRKPFTAYRDQYPRFMSEFGFQALPPMATIKTYADEADWNMTSYIMEQHQKNANGNSLIVGQMLDSFRLPKDFTSLVYLSMVLQAEGIRYGVEHWRRHMDWVAGTLYWQLNDCWPVASWSSLDYYGRWKALHYAARRFYAPLMLSIEDNPPKQALYVTSDLQEPWDGSIHWALETLAGEVLVSGEEAVKIAPLSPVHIRTLDFSDRVSEHNKRELVFVAELRQTNQCPATQVSSFVPTKHLSLKDPAIHSSLRGEKDQLFIEVQSQSLARLVEISLEGADVVFSDNYFDLPAKRLVTVTCPLPSGWNFAQASAALRIRSIYDTFAHESVS